MRLGYPLKTTWFTQYLRQNGELTEKFRDGSLPCDMDEMFVDRLVRIERNVG